MRIVLLSAASSVHTLRWANAFAARGGEVHVVSQHAPLEGYAPAVRIHRLPHRAGGGYLLNGRRFRQFVANIAPDVVNAHYATGYGTLARSLRDVPVVLNVWGSDVYDFPEKGPLHRWWLRRNLRHANVVVSTSRAMAARTMEICPGLGAPVVVPFGVDTSLFKPARTDRSGAPVVIGTVKTLAHKYGIDTLIEAFALIVQRPGMPVCTLRIVGGGEERGRLEALVAERAAGGKVTFVGPVPHGRVPAELQALDIYVALSRLDSESFGVAAIEASACGLPVVVSDASGLREVTLDGVTGLVVPRNDPAAAADALAALVNAPERRIAMGLAGRAHVLEAYEWSGCVDRMLNVLTSAIAARR